MANSTLLSLFQTTMQGMGVVSYCSYTGDTTLGSASLTNMSSIVSLDVTFAATGTGIPQDARINAAPSGSTVVLNREATETATTSTFTFSKILFALPNDFDRIIDYTQWDDTRRWSMVGPQTAQSREFLRNGFISSAPRIRFWQMGRSEEHTSELQSQSNLVCRLLLEK